MLASAAGLGWIAAVLLVPFALAWAVQLVFGTGAAMGAWVVGLVLVVGGSIVGAVVGTSWSERRAAEELRRIGATCTAHVKMFRRISMTQHRVMLAIQHPSGPFGREYVLVGLDDRWLADVCALEKPVRVIAHPDATTVVFDR